MKCNFRKVKKRGEKGKIQFYYSCGLGYMFLSIPPILHTHRTAPDLFIFLFCIPAPVHRPLPYLHPDLHSSDRPGPNPTQPRCCTHYPGPRHLSDRSWLEASQSLDSTKPRKRGQAGIHRLLILGNNIKWHT